MGMKKRFLFARRLSFPWIPSPFHGSAGERIIKTKRIKETVYTEFLPVWVFDLPEDKM
jgi:hypothetical protein